MAQSALTVLDQAFSIDRFSPNDPVPPAVFEGSPHGLGKTGDELSLVCDSSIELGAREHNPGWSCLEVAGPVDFSVNELIAGISDVLASAAIGVFVISTFDTDYILLQSENLAGAKRALTAAGYAIAPPRRIAAILIMAPDTGNGCHPHSREGHRSFPRKRE